MNRYHDYRPRHCRRDPDNGWILGVCAGLARFFGWSLALTRIVTAVLAWFCPLHMLVAYLLLALIMPEPVARRYDRYRQHERYRAGLHGEWR